MNRLLHQSLIKKKPIEIIYQSKDNTFTKRVILVKMLNEKYIKAYCYTKKSLRIFKIDSILATAPVKEDRKERYYA